MRARTSTIGLKDGMGRDVLHLLAVDPDLPAVAQRLAVLFARSDHSRVPAWDDSRPRHLDAGPRQRKNIIRRGKMIGNSDAIHPEASALFRGGRRAQAASPRRRAAIQVSQPSISEAIAHLEEAFDLQLFVRHHAQGLSLDAGRPAACCWRRAACWPMPTISSQSAGGLADALAGDLEVGCFITFALAADARPARRLRRALPRYPRPAA